MSVETYYIGAYWFDRKESVEQIAERTLGFLRDLASCHRLLTGWYGFANPSDGARERPVPANREELLAMFDDSGEDIDLAEGETMGYSLSCWNDHVHLDISAGANRDTPNAVVISVPSLDEPPVAYSYEPAALQAMLRTTVEWWRPDNVVVMSDAYRDEVRFPGDERIPDLHYVGWMTYLSAAQLRGVPDELPASLAERVEVIDIAERGRLYIVRTDQTRAGAGDGPETGLEESVIFTAANPEHVSANLALDEFLRAAGALEHRSQDEPGMPVAETFSPARSEGAAPGSLAPGERLLIHARRGGDYRLLVGVPLRAPRRWSEVRAGPEGLLHSTGEPVPCEEVRAFVAAYQTGDIIEAEQCGLHLPPGYRYLDEDWAHDVRRISRRTLAAGEAVLRVEFDVSPARPRDPDAYATTLTNVSDDVLRIEWFSPAMVSRFLSRVRAVTTTRRYSARELALWYGAPGGVLEPGQAVCDPNNWGAPPVAWVYFGARGTRKSFVAGGILLQPVTRRGVS